MEHEFQADIDAVQSIAAVPIILDVVSQTTGMRFAAVARVTENRWVTCSMLDTINFGLKPGDELPVETTICHEIRSSREAVVINDVIEDGSYCNHPTPRMYGFRSYISLPIILKNGDFFGTLCAIDPAPAQLKNPKIIGMFRLFAELIAANLDNAGELASARAALVDERGVAGLREQFIAVLGHDLRSPLAAVDAGTRILQRAGLDEKSQGVVALMQGSLVRMRGLVDNMLDFARTRVGGGMELDVDTERLLQPVLEQVAAEFQTAHPEREIRTDFDLDKPVPADGARIAQLLSNLLANAITHGARDSPVKVKATTTGGSFELSVENAGEPISEAMLDDLFRPFFRGSRGVGRHGLGLGLYIAQEIARAHGGTLGARSDSKGTCFTFRLPIEQPLLLASA